MTSDKVDNPKDKPVDAGTIRAGTRTVVQLCPYGVWPNHGINQLCDKDALESIVQSFDPNGSDCLVDLEHDSETPDKPTDAAAWIRELHIDPDLGLMATMEWTDLGAAAVASKRLRFLSPCWMLDATGRPIKLMSVGLTNKPAIPVRPITNRAAAPAGVPPEKPKEENAMDIKDIAAALGLPPEATAEQIVAKIKELTDCCAKAQHEHDEHEADDYAEHAAAENKCLNREAVKGMYLANKELCKQFVAALIKPAAAPTPAKATEPVVIVKTKVCNKAEATPPTIAGGTGYDYNAHSAAEVCAEITRHGHAMAVANTAK